MKKIFLLATVSIAAALTISGCADKKSSTAPSPQPVTQTVSGEADTDVTAQAENTTAEPATAPEITVHPDLKPAEGTYVYDSSKLLDSETAAACNDYAELLYEKYLINAAVVTVDKLEGQDAYTYAAEAYNDIYNGMGSGLLFLLNNDTGTDILYKTGSCQSYISDDAEKEAFFWATKDIVAGDVKSAILRMLQLGERCPEYVFNNAGILTNEQVGELERQLSSGKNEAALLVTSNSTGKSSEDILKSYYARRFKDGKGYMAMIDSQSKKVIVHSEQQLPSGVDAALKKANELAAKDDIAAAAKTISEALAG